MCALPLINRQKSHIYDALFNQNYVINFVSPMQEQSLSAVSFAPLLEDAYLGHLFQALQNNQDVAIDGIKMDCQQGPAGNYNVAINPEEVEKGYESDEGPLKKCKNKRIKKRKPLFLEREEQNKKKRIKLYIQSLQNLITELQTENEKLKKINELNIGYIRKLNDSEHIINGFFIDRQKLFARTEKLLGEDDPDISKIEIQIENIRRRQGCMGNERIKAVNYYFKQLLHMIVPKCLVYIADAAYNSTDIFSPNYRSNCQETEKPEYIKKIAPNDEIIQIFLEKQAEIISLKSKLNQKALEMYKNKCDIITLTRQIEKICEGVNVSTYKKAQFLCYAEKYKQENTIYTPDFKKIYEQLQKCNRFSYNNQYAQQQSAKTSKIL